MPVILGLPSCGEPMPCLGGREGLLSGELVAAAGSGVLAVCLSAAVVSCFDGLWEHPNKERHKTRGNSIA